MLVEINLLPQKDPKKFALFIVLGALLTLMLFTGVYYYFQISSTNSAIDNTDRQISMTQKIREKEEAKVGTVESSDSINQLKSAIDWADTYPIQTIPVMRHLTSLLPERGFIQSFGYTEEGTISLTVQFDNPREAAYFLDSVQQSKWIEDASLSALTANVQEEKTADAASDSTAQTAGQNPAAPVGTIVVEPNADNSSTTPPADQATNQAQTAATTPAPETSPILPRYTGIFEIKLNKIVVQEDTKKGKKDEKGVSGT